LKSEMRFFCHIVAFFCHFKKIVFKVLLYFIVLHMGLVLELFCYMSYTDYRTVYVVWMERAWKDNYNNTKYSIFPKELLMGF